MAIARTGEQFTSVGEIELAYETFGERADPPVLLVMGLGSQMIYWPDELCEALAADGYLVVRFDNRDAGRSSVLDRHEPPDLRRVVAGELEAPYLLADMAADAVGLLDALEIDRAHVVGASLGGMIAQRVAIDRPDRVLSLASIMSTTGDPEVGRPTPEAMAVLMTRAPADREGYIRATLEARAVIGSQPPDSRRILDLAERTYDRGLPPRGHRAPVRRDRRLAGPDGGAARARRAGGRHPRRRGRADRALGRRGDRGGDPRRRAGRDRRHGSRPAAVGAGADPRGAGAKLRAGGGDRGLDHGHGVAIQSSSPWVGSKALKKSLPLIASRSAGAELAVLGLMSRTRVVPTDVPSLVQSSIPWASVRALKNAVPPTAVISSGSDESVP